MGLALFGTSVSGQRDTLGLIPLRFGVGAGLAFLLGKEVKTMTQYIFGLVLVAALLGLWPGSGFTQSKDAREVCRKVNPAGAWRECMRQYDQSLNKLVMDPKWQADQQYRQKQLRLQERALQQDSAIQQLRCQEAYLRNDRTGISVYCN